ncbi:hypothetical protein PENANT_c337G10231, partial [Penicillium antarcticum]
MVENSPIKSAIHEEGANFKLGTRPTKPSFGLRAPESPIKSPSIPRSAAGANNKHASKTIKLSAGLDVAGKAVGNRSHCCPTIISRTLRGSVSHGMLHPSQKHS